ncbi:MAG TPA: DUF3187 family protein [Thermoanaerobaculia bacterium]|nr:DUF3187 family protein [Thermoanaerobaculia bacterium]
MTSPVRFSLLLTLIVSFFLLTAGRAGADDWQPIGLLRSRDLTPFGILRLDLLPAQAFAAPPGTWGYEVDLAYQNTYVLSANVRYYLQHRGTGRAALNRQDVDAIFALPGDAYFVDTEVGLADVGVHYSVDPHWEVELNLPLLHYGGGFLDSTIEGFHSTFGFSNADRNLVPRNDSQYILKVGNLRIADLEPPVDNGVGDPVFGARYALFPEPKAWNLIVEGAVSCRSAARARSFPTARRTSASRRRCSGSSAIRPCTSRSAASAPAASTAAPGPTTSSSRRSSSATSTGSPGAPTPFSSSTPAAARSSSRPCRT